MPEIFTIPFIHEALRPGTNTITVHFEETAVQGTFVFPGILHHHTLFNPVMYSPFF